MNIFLNFSLNSWRYTYLHLVFSCYELASIMNTGISATISDIFYYRPYNVKLCLDPVQFTWGLSGWALLLFNTLHMKTDTWPTRSSERSLIFSHQAADIYSNLLLSWCQIEQSTDPGTFILPSNSIQHLLFGRVPESFDARYVTSRVIHWAQQHVQ